MNREHIHHPALPLALPPCPIMRGVLVIARRTAIHGIHDAQATLLALRVFRAEFRRPLVLIRCLIHDIASASKRSIRIAPCCSPGMTRDEGLLLNAMQGGGLPPLLALTDEENCAGMLPTSRMLSEELAQAKIRNG